LCGAWIHDKFWVCCHSLHLYHLGSLRFPSGFPFYLHKNKSEASSSAVTEVRDLLLRLKVSGWVFVALLNWLLVCGGSCWLCTSSFSLCSDPAVIYNFKTSWGRFLIITLYSILPTLYNSYLW
jgi:hypothetical protein